MVVRNLLPSFLAVLPSIPSMQSSDQRKQNLNKPMMMTITQRHRTRNSSASQSSLSCKDMGYILGFFFIFISFLSINSFCLIHLYKICIYDFLMISNACESDHDLDNFVHIHIIFVYDTFVFLTKYCTTVLMNIN